MHGGETNADGANADDPTARRPPFDDLSAILQKSSRGNSATGSELYRDRRCSLAHSVGLRSRQIELLRGNRRVASRPGLAAPRANLTRLCHSPVSAGTEATCLSVID